MAAQSLKLGTRRSALARAQSAAVARRLEQLHPGLKVELVGIDTRGDRIQDRPLSSVEGKEFFTAEIDAALLGGAVDLTVHSYKDLSLDRSERFLLAAVPQREQPRDIVLFAADVQQRLAAGEEIVIGSSSPRRASFVPTFLQSALPRAAGLAARVRLTELRGNVDSRLRRLHEPRGSARQLDGVVLAFAGLARLWADAEGRALLGALAAPLPRMVLPLSACPAAPAQGALAIECRRDAATTAALLAGLDHAPTRRAVAAERALLAQRGGGCHQRFGATQFELPQLGTLLYQREAQEHEGRIDPGVPQLSWTSATPLPVPVGPVRPWDGSRAVPAEVESLPAALGLPQTLRAVEALFVAHRRALPESIEGPLPRHVWVPGIDTWQALAGRGFWVEGCADGLGIGAVAGLLAEPLLQLPPAAHWTVLTHQDAVESWTDRQVIATYRHRSETNEPGPPADATHLYWHSGAQFERWRGRVASDAQHACGPGKTFEHLSRAGVQNLRMFPQVAQWRAWLQR